MSQKSVPPVAVPSGVAADAHAHEHAHAPSQPPQPPTAPNAPGARPSNAPPVPVPPVALPPRRHFVQMPTPTPFMPQKAEKQPDPEEPSDESWDDDDAPTMGPTPMPNLDAPLASIPSPISSPISPRPASLMPERPPAPPPHPQPFEPMVFPPPSPRPLTPPQGVQSLAFAPTQSVAAVGHAPLSPLPPAAIRTDLPREMRSASFHVLRSRAYSFVLNPQGMPIEIGSGRFAKAYLGEERWLESKTDFRREVVIKILQKGVSDEDHLRFQMEKELLERVQGHPNIVHLFASGESEEPDFIPPSIREHVESEFLILERLEMSLEERLKGSRSKGKKDDLLACDMRERIFRVLDYVIPVASAIEYAHLVRNICHRDIKPANVLLRLPDPNLRGGTLEVRLADFNVAKLHDQEVNYRLTRLNSVPGTLFFQSPEQETNTIELLVNVTQGSAEVEFFEDFYIQIAKNDTFSLFNRNETYPILYADRSKKRVVLARPYREANESNVRAKIQKSVGRPADIYSLGALLYYLVTGAYGNPKTLYDAFHKFIEYERADENNTIEAYLAHEYSVINSLSAPKNDTDAPGAIQVAPADRFFSYKHYLDGNGDLIDPNVMKIIARCMIRNKPDSYCQAHEIETRGISELVSDLVDLYAVYGIHPAARPANIARRGQGGGALLRLSSLRSAWMSLVRFFTKRR